MAEVVPVRPAGASRSKASRSHPGAEDFHCRHRGGVTDARRGHMKQTANATFVIRNWDEKPYSEGPDLPKLTRATVTKTYTGDIAGDGQVEYLMSIEATGRRRSSVSSGSSDELLGSPGVSSSSEPVCSKAARRRSPTRSSPAPRR